MIVLAFLSLSNFTLSQNSYPKGIYYDGDSCIALSKSQYLECSKNYSLVQSYAQEIESLKSSKNGLEWLLENKENQIDNLSDQIGVYKNKGLVYENQILDKDKQIRTLKLTRWISISAAGVLAVICIIK